VTIVSHISVVLARVAGELKLLLGSQALLETLVVRRGVHRLAVVAHQHVVGVENNGRALARLVLCEYVAFIDCAKKRGQTDSWLTGKALLFQVQVVRVSAGLQRLCRIVRRRLVAEDALASTERGRLALERVALVVLPMQLCLFRPNKVNRVHLVLHTQQSAFLRAIGSNRRASRQRRVGGVLEDGQHRLLPRRTVGDARCHGRLCGSG